MSYFLVTYFVIFLPAVILVYTLTPQRFRWLVLLTADYVFFCMISGVLIVYLLLTTVLTYYIEEKMIAIQKKYGANQKLCTKEKRKVLAVGVVLLLLVLIVLKYTNFAGENLSNLLQLFHVNWEYHVIKFLVPIGISYYTLQAVAYMTDIYRGTIKDNRDIRKVALLLSFFPQIMEGPISRYGQVAEDLFAGHSIQYENLKFGYQRIVWGLFKKMVIADRSAQIVQYVFGHYQELDGSILVIGVLSYTCQLYMEFSGIMDIIIGTGEIFGITLPENFRQPFMAKSASDFWRRWHITLGAWFKDYIFYPVSLAKPVKNLAKSVKNRFGRNVSKFVAPTIALFCVWTANGLWHGAKWTYIFYGMFYFVIIFVENIMEEPVDKLMKKVRINRKSLPYGIFQVVKLFVIVNIGEMFFRSLTVADGFHMLGRILTQFHLDILMANLGNLGTDMEDLLIILLGVIAVTVVGVFKEKNIDIRKKISSWILPARWGFWYAVIVAIVVFGAYGTGYTMVEMIYAGY